MIEQAVIEYLANAFWQVPLLAAGAWLLLRMVRPGPAAQHRIWLAVLGLALMLPLHGISYGSGSGSGIGQGMARVDSVSTRPLGAGVQADAFDAVGEPGGVVLGRQTVGTGPLWMTFPMTLPARVRRVQLSAVAAQWIVGLYLAVALFGLFRIAWAWRTARRLVKDSREIALPDRAGAAVLDCARRFGVKPPEVRESNEIRGPVVVGAVAPVLLWPENFANYPEDEVMAALCHEMAHIKRGDYLMNLLCETAALPLRWHPAVYGVGRRIRGTREMVCDAMAAEAMQSETAYAKCLLRLAQSMVGDGLMEQTAGSAAAGLFSSNVLEERVMRLMQGKAAMSVRAKAARGVAGAAAMTAAIVLAAMFHVVPAMAQSDAAQKVTGGVQGGVIDGVQGGIQQGVKDGVADGVVAPDVKVRPAAPEVNVSPISPVVKVSPVVTVAPLEKLAMVSPVVKIAPMVKVSPVMTVTPVIKVRPLRDLTTVSPVIHVTPEIKMLPEVQATPEPQEKPNGGTSGANGSDAGAGSGHGTGSGSGQGTGHRMYAVVNGQERELTPAERARVEAQLAEAQKKIAAEMERLNSPEFRQQMEDAQRKAMEADQKLNSGELQEQMAKAQKQIAEAEARVNSPEFKEQMENAQRYANAAAQRINSAEFQKQMADAQKQVAETAARLNSPEFREQMEKAQRDAEAAAQKMNSPEFQKRMAEAQKQLADALKKVMAEQDSLQHDQSSQK